MTDEGRSLAGRNAIYQSLDEVDSNSTAPDGYGASGSDPNADMPETVVGVRSPIMSIFVVDMNQSYVATLIVMMVSNLPDAACLHSCYVLSFEISDVD